MRKFYLKLIALLTLLISLQTAHAAIVLNEIMPCNISTQLNDLGNYTGWVEVYNNGSSPVNIQGYTFVNTYLKSGETKTQSWTVPGSMEIAAGGYKLIFFDEEAGANHASYKIETAGGTLLLMNGSTEIDKLSFGEMYAHISYGRNGNNTGYLASPTPNAENSNIAGVSRTRRPSFGTTPGVCQNPVSLTLTTESGATIYYTINGSEPTESSTRYSGAIPISQTTVVRARAYREGKMMSDITTGSFIFLDSYHSSSCGNVFSVPIVSISTKADNFFGNQWGIYVEGTNGIEGKCIDWDPGPKNYNQDWKRPVNFEYFVNGEQKISQELDAAVMGGCSRKDVMKSLKLTASKKLGNNKIPYDFFPNVKPGMEYKSLQLRNGGNDYYNSRVRDGFMQTLIQGRMNIDYQGYQPVAFYINGEYWGHMGLRERTNKDYVFSNYGLDEEDIDLLEITGAGVEASTGDLDAYDNLIREAQIGINASDYYEKMNRLMDMDEYLDYQIFEQYIANTDWPGNNTKLWRENKTGRFRWIVYDTDFGFGLYPANYAEASTNMITFCLGQNPINWANNESRETILFHSLMQNETFKQKFLNKFILHLGTTFKTSRVISILDSVRANAKQEICAHWKRHSSGYYNDDYVNMVSFGNQRPGKVYGHLKTYYGLGQEVNLSISSNISNADFIMNGERMNTSSYSGKYFKNMNLKVEPIAPPGYKFVSWNQESSSVTEPILDNNSAWKYYYEGDLPSADWFKNSYNDSSWDDGFGKMGYRTPDNTGFNTVLDYGLSGTNKYITAYFRTSFDIDDLSAVDELEATLTYDDGAIVYLNGKEIKRYNMPAGTVSYETTCGEDNYVNDEVVVFAINKQDLQSGRNVMAIEIHQNVASSSDLTLKLDLVGILNSTASSNQAYNSQVSENLDLKAIFESCDYVKPTLVINELCTSNHLESEFANEYGIYADWLEIYNSGDKPVDLAGMYLTDNPQDLDSEITRVKYQFPLNNPFETTVLPGEHKIIWADKEPWQGSLHANFKLSATTSSTVVLAQMVNGTMQDIDRVTYELHQSNETYGRVTDGASQWQIFDYCSILDIYLSTPGEANGSKVCRSTVPIEEIADDNAIAMKLYPNPAKTFLHVAVNTTSSYTIQVYDNSGLLIENIQTDKTESLNVENYAAGVYIVRVITPETVLQQKFVKY